jgi:hypothetical protein
MEPTSRFYTEETIAGDHANCMHASLAAAYFLLMSYNKIAFHSAMSVNNSVVNRLQLVSFICSTAMVRRYTTIT